MVKGIFEEISLGADEDMGKEPAEVFSELNDVEGLHLKWNIADFGGDI